MAEALVEFDYKAQASDELTIKKGDIITDITFIPGGWWEGTLKGGKRGMFPDNFVKLIKNEDGENTPTSSGRKCKVLFPYKPLNEDELELEVGDVIDIISEVEEGWWKGSLRHMIGVFPSNFVAEITDLKSETREASQRKPKLSRDESLKHSTIPQRMSSTTTEGQSGGKTAESSPDVPVLPPKPAKEVCKALYKYEANNSDELSLHPGDVICLISKEGQDPGWWKGELRGRVGVFPDNFVEVLSPPHHPSETNKSEKSSKMLSNRGSISKSATTSSICDSITSITRKISDTSKTTDDKMAPTVGKKPPPPLKKPQTTPHPTTTTTTTTKLLDSPPGHTARLISSTSTTIKHSSTTAECSNLSSNSKWTVVETSDGTDGLCWGKQQSYSFKNENNTSSVSVSSSNSSGVALTGGELDLDAVGRTAMLTHPTASRAKAPRSRRPPSTILLREDMLKNGEEVGSPEGSAPSTLMNGDAGSHQEHEKPSGQQPPPWVEELKLNQAKKSIQGKTRVMIGGGGGLSGPSPADGTAGQLAQSPPTADSLLSRVTLRSSRLSGVGGESQPPPQRPQSMVSSLKSLGSVMSPSPSVPATTSEPQVTVSLKQWNTLVDKVTNLETHMESQMNGLTKALKELTGKLDEERQRRMVLQQELEKLTELVTQV